MKRLEKKPKQIKLNEEKKNVFRLIYSALFLIRPKILLKLSEIWDEPPPQTISIQAFELNNIANTEDSLHFAKNISPEQDSSIKLQSAFLT